MNSIGRLQRSTPLPVGDYWIDVIDVPNQVAFNAWAFENTGKVSILTTEHQESLDWPDCEFDTPGDRETLCAPSIDWVKFRVLTPVNWDAKRFGFPNIIAEGEKVESSTDTVDPGDQSDYCDIACQANRVAISAAVVAASVIGVLVAVKLS